MAGRNGFVACFEPNGPPRVVKLRSLDPALPGRCRGRCRGTSISRWTWNGNSKSPAPFYLGPSRKPPHLPGGGNTPTQRGDVCLIKVKGDGTRILWGTWFLRGRLGARGMHGSSETVRMKLTLLCSTTQAAGMPFKTTMITATTISMAEATTCIWRKVSPDGEHVLYGTYFGRQRYGQYRHAQPSDRRERQTPTSW